jgi:dienelactone hydrolase
MLAGMRLAFAESVRPTPDEVAMLAGSARPYLDPVLQRHPRRFFAGLDEPRDRPAVRTLESRRIPGGAILVREFESEYTPWHTSASWPTCPENARVPVQHWMHCPGRPRAVVLALHGFSMGHPWLDARILMAEQWFERGYDVVLPILPFHGCRAPRWTRYSGEAFASWDVRRLNESVRQAIYDVDLVRRWLLRENDAPVGVLGLSLGGYLTALLAGLRSDLAFAVPVAAPASLAWLPQRLFHFGHRLPLAPPMPPDVLARAYRVHSPLSFPLTVPRERTIIVGGRGDGVVPPEQVTALWRHWGAPRLHWFSGGHTTPFGRARLLESIDAHVRALL